MIHVSLTIIRDSGELELPTTYLRDRQAFSSPEEARRYHERLLAWLARRPAPESLDEELEGYPSRWRPAQLAEILDRMDEWAPLPKVYDWNA